MMLHQRCAQGSLARGLVATGRCRVRPFTAAVKPQQQRQQHVRRAAEPEAQPEPALVEEEEEVEEEEQQFEVVLDEEAKLALQTAEYVMSGYAAEAMLEAPLLADQGQREALLQKANALLLDGLESAGSQLDEQVATTASLAMEALELAELEVEDEQSAAGFRKYDEEEDNAVPEAMRAAVSPLKLSRQELANLVPQDWSTMNVDWFTSKKDDKVPLPEYKLSFLWQKANLAVAVDQVYSRGQTSPLTEYFFWPRKDAWEELNAAMQARPWISERDRIILLNRLTEVINFWQDETGHAVDEAKALFPDCTFA